VVVPSSETDISQPFEISIAAPSVRELAVHVGDGVVPAGRDALGRWTARIDAVDGEPYSIYADGVGPLLDPSARRAAIADGVVTNIVQHQWPSAPQLATRAEQPVIYELHVKGFAEDFAGTIGKLPWLADLGVDVIELMPVHPFDAAANYWGYMPLVWGAVHEPYGDGVRAPAESLSLLIHAAHAHGIEVWLDIVVNHTGEGDASLPTLSLRGLADDTSYRRRADGSYTDDSGCGNDVNPSDAEIRRLILEALDRFADLGVDGLRFDLASLLTRDDGGMVSAITAWGGRRGVRLVAEPWDLAAYQVGSTQWPAPWMQWNDRFRDDVRGFVRAEPGMVPALMQRLAGSPDLFGERPTPTINFVTAHDGLTLHDLTIVTSDHHRSWDCGDELRPQMLRNYLTLLLLADGAAMFVMGDECGRTQHGEPNPYDVDSPLTWMDWARAAEWQALRGDVQRLIELRSTSSRRVRSFHGVGADVDGGWESRALAWSTDDLYVMANMWWEPLDFEVQQPGPWTEVFRTGPPVGADGGATSSTTWTVGGRSIVVLRRNRP
jgi:isoamylase